MSQLIQTLRMALSGAESESLSDPEIRDVIKTIVSDEDRELDTKCAADHIGYSAPTLKLWRYNNKGPKFRKDCGGRIRYKVRWLNDYMNEV
jgi:hypothetical protein